MLTARFYSFSKRNNSTMRPAENAGLVYDILLKGDTSLIRPSIIMYFGRQGAPEYNYVYIPDLHRYYFIDNWNYIENCNWMAECTCDVLATYKYDIAVQQCYVVRSASRSNSNIPDMLYPVTNDVITQTMVFTNPMNMSGQVEISQGCFIVGIDSYDAYYGCVDYFIISPNDMADLCDWLMNDFITAGHNFTIDDASLALQRALVNPMQFIKSCIWIPIPYATITASCGVLSDVLVFAYNTGISAFKITGTPVYTVNTVTLRTMNHPQFDSHGKYMNSSPFTELALKYPPFGVITLDPTIVANAGSLSIYSWLDLITGQVIAEVRSGVNTLNRIATQCGVQIQLSQVTRNVLGAVTSAVSAVRSAATLDFLGAANGIGNAISAAAPKVNTLGSNGGFSDLYGDIEMMYTFYMQTDVNVFEHGRPLMQWVQIGTLTGYMECESADVVIDCTADERAAIVNFMESGFFYE